MSVKLNHAIGKVVKLGVLNDVPSGQLMTLFHIIAIADDNGVVKVSNTRLAEITGRTRKTIAGDVKKLEEILFNNDPIIKKSEAIIDGKSSEVLKLNAVFLSEVRIGDNKAVNVDVFIDDMNENKLGAKELVKLFAKTYREEFGVNYIINWARDMALVKKGLIGKYSDEELEEIIEVAVREYSKRWATREYPRPTITMLTKWLGERALGVIATRKKEELIVEKYEKERTETKEASDSRLEGLFGV